MRPRSFIDAVPAASIADSPADLIVDVTKAVADVKAANPAEAVADVIKAATPAEALEVWISLRRRSFLMRSGSWGGEMSCDTWNNAHSFLQNFSRISRYKVSFY